MSQGKMLWLNYQCGFVIGLVLSRRTFCNTDLQTKYITREQVQYSLDSCSSRNIIHSRSHYLPHTLLNRLQRQLHRTRCNLSQTLLSLTNSMTGQIEQCYQQSDDIPKIQSATNMNDFLLSSFEAVSSISLNLTIVNCHRRSQSLVPDVYSDSSNILCYLRQLLYRVPVERSLCNPHFTLPTNLSENNLLPFTCKNIHRAISLYREMESKLQELWAAETSSLC